MIFLNSNVHRFADIIEKKNQISFWGIWVSFSFLLSFPRYAEITKTNNLKKRKKKKTPRHHFIIISSLFPSSHPLCLCHFSSSFLKWQQWSCDASFRTLGSWPSRFRLRGDDGDRRKCCR